MPVKIIISGGHRAGKTTTVTSIDPGRATSVAMDFGSVTIDQTLKLYLFGTPGQPRFAFMWDALIRGALGALVVVDTARLNECSYAVDYFGRCGLPFVVGVNTFPGRPNYAMNDVRWALAVDDSVPVLAFDARSPASVRDALLIVLDRAMERALG